MSPALKQDLIWTLGLAAVTGGALFGLTRPQYCKARDLRVELASERDSLRASKTNLQELPTLQEEVSRLRRRTDAFEQQVPTRDQIGEYLESIATSAQKRGLRPQAVEPGAPVQSKELFGQPIKLKVAGPFREVYGLIKDITHGPRLTQVQKFEAKVVPDRPGEVQAEVQLRVFYRAS